MPLYKYFYILFVIKIKIILYSKVIIKSHKLKFGPKMYFSNFKKLGNNTIKYIIINKKIKIYQRYFTGMSFP